MMKKTTIFFLFYFIFCANCYSQSPRDLTSNIGQNAIFWFNNVSSLTDVEDAYNDARRSEETQLSLVANSISDLSLPSESVWNGYSILEKVLYLLNDERKAREGIDYGDGSVLGLPFQGLEESLNDLAQGHAEYLLDNNIFSHTGEGSSSPYDRIDDDLIIGSCNEFMTYAENIAAFYALGGQNTFTAEKSVYNWIYEDSGSSWGHRRAALIQDTNQQNATGFTNNFGTTDSEGFIGVGVASSSTYNPNGYSGLTDGDVIVLKIYDPELGATCSFNPQTLNVNHNNIESFRIYITTKRNLKFVGLQGEDLTLSMYNILGEQILKTDFLSAETNTITLPNVKKGVYFFTIETFIKKWSTKMILK